MAITQDFRSIPLDKLIDTCKERKNEGYRLAHLCPKLERDDSITLIYTFVKESEMINYKVSGIKKGVTEVPSVTELFIAAFVFENEAHDLFGVNVVGNLIDFQGKFYSFAEGVEAPMTIVTPAQLAAREKAAKLAAAKAGRAAKAKQKDAKPSAQSDEELEAKLSKMDPEKAAKVRAAMKAKAAKAAKTAASSSANDLEDKLAGMDPEKAAKVRAAMEAKAKRQAETAAKEGE
mgnify:FL=1